MRELVFKNLTSEDRLKRDVFVEEVVEKDGVQAKTTRRCLYFIKEKVLVKGPADMQKISDMKMETEKYKKHFHVLKEHKTSLGEDKLMCKVAGTFYAMVNQYLYCIVFVHTFKITFSAIKHT